MNKTACAFLIAVLFFGCCDRTENRLIYFDNDNLKAELTIKNGLKNGYCKFYYANGDLLHEGAFQNDLKVGKHLEYFENSQSIVQFEVYYEIVDGREVAVKRIKYNQSGIAI